MAIFFYKRLEKHGYLSNFAHYSFMLDNTEWKTVEHYFQAQKFKNIDYKDRIISSSTPMEAAKLGRNKEVQIIENWDNIKLEVMKKAIYAKFSQNEDIKKMLLSTYPQQLFENTRDDYFWGIGLQGTGINMLGKLLMEVRDNLLDKQGGISGNAINGISPTNPKLDHYLEEAMKEFGR